MIAYINDYKLLMVLTLAMVPLVLIIGTSKRQSQNQQDESVVLD